MISDDAVLIPLNSIKILEGRRPVDMAHAQALALSIAEVGFLSPIVVYRKDNSLLAGLHRFVAHGILGREEILARYAESMDPFQLKLVELEENLRRLDLSWDQEVDAIAELHTLHKETYGADWGVKESAQLLDRSVGTVQNAISVAKELEKAPELRKEKRMSHAVSKISLRKQFEAHERTVTKAKRGENRYLLGNALDLIKEEESESFDLVLTNFPFGIDIAGKGGETYYQDSEQANIDLVRGILPEIYRVLKPNSWFIGFYDTRKITFSNKQEEFFLEVMKKNPELRKLGEDSLGLAWWLREVGFQLSFLPSVWTKPDCHDAVNHRPNISFFSAYESFVIAAKGDPILKRRGRQNVFSFDLGPEREMGMEMPLSILEELIALTCYPNARVLDPFGGSTSSIRAAINQLCFGVAYEIMEDRFKQGSLLLDSFLLKGEG